MRYCFALDLKDDAGLIAQYESYHKSVWPEIIESIKEKYISHHLKDKSYRRTALYCGISRSMIKRIAEKIEMNNHQMEQQV